MIERKRILSLGYYDRAASFTGSDKNKNFKVEKIMIEQLEDGNTEPTKIKMLQATVWPGPFCFDKTDDDKKISQTAAFSEDGLIDLVNWMNSIEF